MSLDPSAAASNPNRVIVVGGGISGLSTAYFLIKQAKTPLSITVLEGASRFGGNLFTERRDDFLLDGGPDSWVASKPHAARLAKALNLADGLMPTQATSRRVYSAFEKGLYPYPEGLVFGIPTRLGPITDSPLLSWSGKARICAEPFLPRHFGKQSEDESLEEFFVRRLGHEMTERLVAPLLGGIFAGDAKRISLEATFPQLIEAEERYGSLVRAMRPLRRPKNAVPASTFLSLRSGLGTLIDALVSEVQKNAVLRLGCSVRAVARVPKEQGRYIVELDGGESLCADTLVMAVPAPAASKILCALDTDLADRLSQFVFASTATVFLAYPREDIHHPLNGSGFLVPSFLGRPTLAGTWVSSKWTDRAPNGFVLLRVFFGGANGGAILRRDDDALIALGRSEIQDLMGIAATPLFGRVFRFMESSPQPEIGHLGRVDRLRIALRELPGMHIIGAGYDGVGIPDCIRQAEAVAEQIHSAL